MATLYRPLRRAPSIFNCLRREPAPADDTGPTTQDTATAKEPKAQIFIVRREHNERNNYWS